MVKRPYDFLQNTVGKFVGKYLSSNQLSVIAFLLVCISTFFYVKRMLYHATFILLISGIVDALDGMVARAMEKSSLHGEMFDLYFDKLGHIVLIMGLGFSGLVEPLLVGTSIGGILFFTLIRCFGKIEKKKNVYNLNIPLVRPPIFFTTFINLNIGMLIITVCYWLCAFINSMSWLSK